MKLLLLLIAAGSVAVVAGVNLLWVAVGVAAVTVLWRLGATRKRAALQEMSLGWEIEFPGHGEPGAYKLGRRSDGQELRWVPGDPMSSPHLLAVATTGGGKSELLGLIAAQQLHWGWPLHIISPKAKADFHAYEQAGAEVIKGITEIRKALERAWNEIDRRNRILDETEIKVVDRQGVVRVGARARNLAEVPIELRERDEWKPQLWIVDELSLVTSPELGEEAKKCSSLLSRCTQAGRSVGVFFCLATQRTDVDKGLPGFVKNNCEARWLGGKADHIVEAMVFGAGVQEQKAAQGLSPERGPGRGLHQGIQGSGLGLVQLYRFDPASLLPTEDEQIKPPRGADHVSWVGRERRLHSADNFVLLDSEATPRRSPNLHGVKVHRTPSPSPGLLAELGRLVRAPWARARLRVRAWRWVSCAQVSDPPPRVPALAAAARARDGARCRCCWARKGPFEVDHKRAREVGGAERLDNLWVLCVKCHGIKTRAEAGVRKWRLRLRRTDWMKWALGLAVITGAGAWAASVFPWWYWIGPGCVFYFFAKWEMDIRGRRRGLDGIGAWEERLETAETDVVGRQARREKKWRRKGIVWRWKILVITGTFLAGGGGWWGWQLLMARGYV